MTPNDGKEDSPRPQNEPLQEPRSGPQTPHVPDKLFRLMVDKVKDYAIFMLDTRGRIISWNAGAERIKGYRPEEILGEHFSVFYTKEDVKSGMPQRELEIASALGRVDVEGWRLRKDGSRFWASVTITSFFDEDGKLLGFGKVTRDISEKRKAEEALQRSRNMFERLFENSPDAVVVVDANGVIRKINKQAEALFAYMREELIGHRIEYLIPERYHKAHRQHRRGYFSDPRVRKMGIGLELYARNRDALEFPVDVMLSPIESTEGTWAFAVIRDITQQKQNEALITELNRALKVQVDQLGASNRELESFSYSVSHDLRAPLRHIIGFIKLLEERDLSSLDEKSHHYLRVIADAAQRMGVLIDDLLSFSRMGRAEMMKTQIDLAKMVQEVIGEMADETRGRDVDWKVAPLPVVTGDAAMLRQVMVNLIANALKFTRPRPQAKIEIGAITDRPNETLVYVRDNGVGFDPRYVDKLFSLFQRLHSTEEFEGTGVGLANVQRILHRHGGRAWAEGTPDAGATFWFALPKMEG